MPYKDPEKTKESCRKYREAHSEQLREKNRKYRIGNPEKIRDYGRKHRLKYLEEYREYQKLWAREDRIKNPEKYRESCRRYKRKHKARLRVKGYGISPEEFEKMFAVQKGICKICCERGATHIDHNHETGKVRGLLCHNCNVALGLLKDSIPVLGSAIYYLSEQ